VQAGLSLQQKLRGSGLTEETQKAWADAAYDNDNKLYCDFHFVWARKEQLPSTFNQVE
jgi:hypothetical protein